MPYTHIKLVNGDDLIGQLVQLDEKDESSADLLAIYRPLKISIDPIEGVMCQVWNTLTEGDVVVIHKNNAMYWGAASERATGYYAEFERQMSTPEEPDEMEELFNAMQPKDVKLH